MTKTYPSPGRRLRALHTPFGARGVYDSAAYCTRCGCCQQACPSYLARRQETFSPRGRNQILRLWSEGKLDTRKNKKLLEDSVNACLLCGRCTQACAGKIPTAEHILELRRALRLKALPFTLQKILELRGDRPKIFNALLRLGFLLRRAGFIKLLYKTGVARALGLGWLKRADEMLPKQTPELGRFLRKRNISAETKNPTLIYLPSLEAEFFIPDLAAAVLKTAAAKHRPVLWHNTSSGLFEYVYGDLRKSRRAVRRLIVRHAQAGFLPLVTDSADVYLFLHRAPQLFAGYTRWEEKARRFAANIFFITDLFPSKLPAAHGVKTPVRLDFGTLFAREGEPFDSAAKILKTHFKKNFVECLYTDADTPAFGYGFVRNNLAEEAGLNAVRAVARTQTQTVFTLSGLCALELAYHLRRFYPHAQAQHIARLNG